VLIGAILQVSSSSFSPSSLANADVITVVDSYSIPRNVCRRPLPDRLRNNLRTNGIPPPRDRNRLPNTSRRTYLPFQHSLVLWLNRRRLVHIRHVPHRQFMELESPERAPGLQQCRAVLVHLVLAREP
jgi:hypothetical protein